MLRPLLIAALALLSPTMALPWAAPVFQHYCQFWYTESDKIKSCQIELTAGLRAIKSSLQPAEWFRIPNRKPPTLPIRIGPYSNWFAAAE